MSKVAAKNRVRQNRILRILLEQGDMSITDLASQTGMTIPMVTRQLELLRSAGFTHDNISWDSERVGRPPIVARLRGDAGCILGIDIGHRNTNLVLLNLQQKVVAQIHQPSVDLTQPVEVINALTESLEQILQQGKIKHEKLLGIGVSIPGIVRGREGRSETYLNFGTVSLRDVLEDRWKTKVLIEHDAKAMAMGEYWFGAARNLNNVLCINFGWGLGLGIIINGKLVYGKDGYAGEFGHINIIDSDKKCICGKTGCLETVVSGRAIAARAKELIASGRDSMLVTQGIDVIEAEHVVNAALAGDECCREIIAEAGTALGRGISVLVNLFNPEMVILGGRVATAGEILLTPISAQMDKDALSPLRESIQCTVSSLGPTAGALGVAMLASRDIFEIDHLNPAALI